MSVPELVLQGRTLGEAGQVLANALRKGSKERAASKSWDGDVGRHGPPNHELVLEPQKEASGRARFTLAVVESA